MDWFLVHKNRSLGKKRENGIFESYINIFLNEYFIENLTKLLVNLNKHNKLCSFTLQFYSYKLNKDKDKDKGYLDFDKGLIWESIILVFTPPIC